MKKVGMIVISIVCCLALTIMPTFAAVGSINSINSNFELYNDNGSTLTMQIQATSLSPFLLESNNVPSSYNYYYQQSGSSTPNGLTVTQGNIAVYQQDFIVMVRLANNTTSDLFINQGYGSISVLLANNASTNVDPNSSGVNYEIIQGNLFDVITTISASNGIQARWSSEFTYNSGLVIPAKSVLYSQIVFHAYYTYAYQASGYPLDPVRFAKKISSINLNAPTTDKVSTISNFTLMNANYNSIEQVELLDSIYQELILLYGMENQKLSNINTNILQLIQHNHTDLTQIHTDLQAILDAYTTNASNTQSTQSNITEVGSEESQLHQAELNYYQQNQQALQNVGISNFSFDTNQSSGLGAVVSDFTDLWNNIGPLQIIFTFTLSMSLATYLLRHKPITGAIKQNERKK